MDANTSDPLIKQIMAMGKGLVESYQSVLSKDALQRPDLVSTVVDEGYHLVFVTDQSNGELKACLYNFSTVSYTHLRAHET